MQWIARYYDNVYLLTDEKYGVNNGSYDEVVYTSPEDKTIVVDHRSINDPSVGQSIPYKIVWCYEPGEKMAGPLTWLPFMARVAATTIAADLVPVQALSQPSVVDPRYYFEIIQDTGYQ